MAEPKPKKKKKKKSRQGPGPLRRAGQWVVYALFRVAETVVRVLPAEAVFVCGQAGGLLAWAVAPGYRTLALGNLRIAFGGQNGEAELRQLCRRHFMTLGANLFSAVKIPTMSEEEVNRRAEIVGIEHVRSAIRDNLGFVYALAHMGNWELLAQLPAICPMGKPGTLYQPLGNPFLDAHVRRARGRFGFRLFSRNDGFHAPVQFLRDGGGLGVLLDQHAGDGGVWSPLFGRLASTTNLAGLLTLRTGAATLPLGLFTVGRAKWRIVVSPPVIVPDPDPSAMTAATNEKLEALIRQSPADWFWVHNRWKTPRPNFLLANYKRGVCLPPDFMPEKLKPFEILVRAPNWLGDACMCLPAVRALKRGRPDARVTVLTPAKLADFWRVVGDVDEVLEKPEKSGLFGTRKVIKSTGRKYDVAVLMTGSPRTALEVWKNGIDRIVGYRGRWRKVFLNQIVPEREPGPVEHHVYHFLRIAENCGAEVTDESLFDPVAAPPAHPRGARLQLGLCAGAEYGPAKRWPRERFAEAALSVLQRTGCEWVLLGAKGDVPLAAEVEQLMRGKCRNLAGKTTLTQLMQELVRCRLVLTNDTGTMHLAAALGVPTVSVFGSTEPNWTGPLGEHHLVLRKHVACSPCFLRECPLDFRCMTAITPDEAADAVMELLAEVVAA